MSTTIYLIRHSEKQRAPLKPYPGYDRIQPLSVNGERKAQRLLDIEELRHADAAYCSPFSRTISTLRYLMEEDRLRPTLDERLKELEFGGNYVHSWEHPEPPEPREPGKPPRHDPNSDRARQWVDRDLALPGGESLNQCAARMAECIRDIVEAHPGETVLVGSHGAAICAYLSRFMSEIGDEYTGALPQPAVFCLTFDGSDVPAIRRLTLSE